MAMPGPAPPKSYIIEVLHNTKGVFRCKTFIHTAYAVMAIFNFPAFHHTMSFICTKVHLLHPQCVRKTAFLPFL